MVSSGFLAFGIAMYYASTGTLDMPIGLSGIRQTWSATGMLLSLGLILTVAGFKISFVPFHLWTPDVYQGAPTPVTALLTTGSKNSLWS
jgi:NADH-quinone oxidoreductase subunit N